MQTKSMFHDCFESLHVTYMHVSKEKGLNMQFSKAGEMRSQIHGTRDEKQKFRSKNEISYWFSLF